MARAIFTSDLHLHPYRIGSQNGGMDRLQDGIRVLDRSLALARERACPWINCGDFKMPKRFWIQDALNGALATFEKYADVPKLMIPGNHDGMYGEWGSGLAPFRHLATVIDTPTQLDFHGLSLACWPYGLNRRDEYLKFLTGLKPWMVLVAHAFVRGVSLGPMDVHLPGRGVDVDTLLGPCKVAVLGDIHKGQWWHPVGRGTAYRWSSYSDLENGDIRSASPWKGELFYPGSPYQQSWGEVTDWPKGVLELDQSSGIVTMYPIPSPRFRSIDLREKIQADVVDDDLAGPPGFWADDVVRILLGATQKGRTLDSLITALRDRSGARSVTTIPYRATPQTVRSAAVNAGMPQPDLFRRYVESKPLEGVDAETIIHAGLTLAKEE